MNLVCEKELLLKILSIAINSINERSTVESLKCFKLETDKDNIIVTSNNLETNIICKMPAVINKPGKTLVHARTFYNIVSKLPHNEISMYVSENNTLLIRSGQSTFNIYTMNYEEFPEDMTIEKYNEIKLDKNVFKDMIRRVSFSASDEEEKIILNAEVKSQYEDLLKLNLVFDGLDLDEPSMSFTRNVMESVAMIPAPVAMKTKVDKKIIYGIGGFFVISLLALLGYVFYNVNLEMPKFDLKVNLDLNLEKYVTPTAIYAFLFADLVIGLIFLDQFLRKKIAQK